MAEPAEQEFLRSIFLMEAWDTVAALDRAAATLERAGGVDELFVVTHRLKGAASLHGFSKIAALAAELEDVLGARPPDARKLSTLAGHLRRALDAVADGAPSPAGAGAEAARPAEAAPAPASPGVPTARSPRAAAAAGASRMSADPLRKELETFFAGNADVLAYFLPEATEHLEGVTAALSALERGPDAAELARLFRTVHTLKGAAYVVGCVRVGEVAHRMEDVLVTAREGSRPLTPAAVETLFAADGALRLMLGLAPDPRASVTEIVATACSGMRSSTVGRKSSSPETTHSATNAGTSAPYFASGCSVAGSHGLSGLTKNAAMRPVVARKASVWWM